METFDILRIPNFYQWVAPAESDYSSTWVALAKSDYLPTWGALAESDYVAPRTSPLAGSQPIPFAARLGPIAIGLLVWLIPTLAWSQYSITDSMITRSLRGRDVLRVQTAASTAQGGPTGVAKVSVIGTKPSPADRDVVVVFYIESYGSDGSNVAYRVPVRLEEGKTSVDVEVPHISFENQSVWDVGIFEDGRDIEDKRGRRTAANWTNSVGQNQALAALISSDEVEATVLKQLEDFSEHISVELQSNRVAGVPLAYVFPLSLASADWRFFFARPIWVLSPAAVAEINQRPEVAQALRTYVAASGFLLVHSVQDAAQLEAVEKLLDQPASASTSWWTTDYAVEQGRLIAKSENYLESPTTAFAKHPIMRQFCFGSVLVTAESLQDMDSAYWKTTLSKLTQPKIIATETDGDWFWRNLIRAVGKPPVWMFCGIVALFGALLGPGLLVFTGRMARRSLMIFLVPAISLVATLAIVFYGVLHEGFDTHVRVTSIQAVDTTSQHGFVWSRQNYFSGLPPRDGLNFSSQTYARGVSAESDRNNYRWDGDPRRGIDSTVTILPDKQNWVGWLRPRQQQQLLIGHAARFPEMPIEVTRSGPSEIQLTNVGPNSLPIVLLRGGRHDYYFAEQLAAEQTISVRGDGLETMRAKVAKLMVDYRPTSPPELGEGGSLLDFGSGSRRYTTQNNYYELDDILNVFFKQRMSDRLELPPFGFAILATESDKVEVPLSGISTENLHLILGTHAW